MIYMIDESIDNSDIEKMLNFIIVYIDMYIEYCHNENLSINGDLTAEIYDNIYILEEYIQNDKTINKEKIEEVVDALVEIKEEILSINDIDLFNHVHIIFEYTTDELIRILKK